MKNKLWHTPKLRLLSAFLAAAMALTMLPAAAFAEEATDHESIVNFGITTGNPAATHYTVTFDLNGGTDWGWISDDRWNESHDRVSFPTQTEGTGEGLTVPLMKGMGPEREGYKFVGWYTARNGGEPVEEQSYYMQSQHLEPITEDITLYAHWQWNGEGPDPDPVPDEPVVDGGDGSGVGAVLAIAGGAAVVGAAGFGIYELATRAILKDLLPEGAAIPATRGELALLLWQNAGKPGTRCTARLCGHGRY